MYKQAFLHDTQQRLVFKFSFSFATYVVLVAWWSLNLTAVIFPTFLQAALFSVSSQSCNFDRPRALLHSEIVIVLWRSCLE